MLMRMSVHSELVSPVQCAAYEPEPRNEDLRARTGKRGRVGMGYWGGLRVGLGSGRAWVWTGGARAHALEGLMAAGEDATRPGCGGMNPKKDQGFLAQMMHSPTLKSPPFTPRPCSLPCRMRQTLA